MLKKFNNHIKNEKGLTLIELLAVVVILAIIAAIAVPSISNIINKQRDKAVLSDAALIINAAKLAIADGACDGTTAAACDEKVLNDFIDGVALVSGDFVAKEADVYSLTWAPKRNGAAYTFKKLTSPFPTATEKQILDLMNN